MLYYFCVENVFFSFHITVFFDALSEVVKYLFGYAMIDSFYSSQWNRSPLSHS